MNFLTPLREALFPLSRTLDATEELFSSLSPSQEVSSQPPLAAFRASSWPEEHASFPQPSFTLSDDFSATSIEIGVDIQPPADVRTRTPSENRTFSISALVYGDLTANNITALKVELFYANSDEVAPSRILGGNRTTEIICSPSDPVGHARFSNLSICEASTKHNEREFQLRFSLVTHSGREIPTQSRTTPFYAYSNQKVLSRRRNLEVRCLSTPSQNNKDRQMHVVGRPFIPGPSFAVLFNTPVGVLPASDIEIFSESVAFFTPPTLPSSVQLPMPAQVIVTNDGRTFSSPLDFQFT